MSFYKNRLTRVYDNHLTVGDVGRSQSKGRDEFWSPTESSDKKGSQFHSLLIANCSLCHNCSLAHSVGE